MKCIPVTLAMVFVLVCQVAPAVSAAEAAAVLRWEPLPPLPDELGFGGPFAGVSNGALIVAGGANFPEKAWGQSPKVWRDGVYVLDRPGGKWLATSRLPRPLAYGASVSTDHGAIFLGGCDATRCYRDVHLLAWDAPGRRIRVYHLPPLPKPCAFTAAAAVGRTVYVAGGIDSPSAAGPMKNFWAMDVSSPRSTWKALPPWPGPARQKAVMGVAGGCVYVLSGQGAKVGPEGKTAMTALTDAYRYDPAVGKWRRIADLPRAAAAAATPAFGTAGADLVVCSGDTGQYWARTEQLKEDHPGFPKKMLGYVAATDRWFEAGAMPQGLATTTAVKWRGRIVIASGEVRPRRRTSKVWWAAPPARPKPKPRLKWSELPPLPPAPGAPDQPQLGLAGAFAGVSGEALIVAGGANFPKGMPWETLPDDTKPPKIWYDDVYVLEKRPGGKYAWRTGFKLPRPLGYGGSVTTKDGVVCIGGCDVAKCYADVFRLRWDAAAGKLHVTQLPPLPQPCAFTSVARIGSTIYLAGGQATTSDARAMKNFWSLDLSSPRPAWKTLPPWPGRPRVLPIVVAQSDGKKQGLYVISGRDVAPEKPAAFLTDAYRFDPATRQWRKLADVAPGGEKPRSVCAGVGAAWRDSAVLVFGGADGRLFGKLLKEKHPGFSRDVLAYDVALDRWSHVGRMPASHVTTNVVRWDGAYVITSGEIKPGIRSPKILRGADAAAGKPTPTPAPQPTSTPSSKRRAKAKPLPERAILTWRPLPALPGADRPAGPVGMFAGVSNGVLLVGGGAAGEAVLSDDVYVLLKDTAGAIKWHDETFTLPAKLAGGVSVTAGAGVVCLGGRDAKGNRAGVFLMAWDKKSKTVVFHSMPPVPKAYTQFGAGALGRTVYVVGGQEDSAPGKATRNFWSLELPEDGPADKKAWAAMKWRTDLPAFPGPPRLRPVVVAQDKGEGGKPLLYVISGRFPGARGSEARLGAEFLTDTYSFDPRAGAAGEWSKPLRPICPAGQTPRTVPGAVGVPFGPFHILVFGGPEPASLGMRSGQGSVAAGDELLAYHTVTDTWVKMGTVPPSAATATTAVKWGKSIVVFGNAGEQGAVDMWLAKAKKKDVRFGTANWAALIGYLVILVAMGLYFSRREKTTEDFFLAGRRVPWWAAGLSIYGTQLSAITFMAIPAAVFAVSWRMYLAQWCIVAITPLVASVYMPFFRRLNVTTAYEYLEKRFNLPVRLLGSISFIIYQFGRMAIVVLLPAVALEAVTGIDIYTCIVLMGVLCTVYTVLGGIEAVIWTDVLQVVVLLGGAIVCLAIVASNVTGSLAGIFSVAENAGKLKIVHLSSDYTTMAVWVVVLGNLFANLIPYTTDQAVIQRYLTTPDERAARKAIWTNALMVIPGSLIFFTLGTALFAFYKSRPHLLEPALQNDAVLPLFILQNLPAGLVGLVIAGVFAAAMSSLDSSMNSVATAVTTDFYRRFKPHAPDRRCLNLARWVTVILGVVATVCALVMGFYGDSIKSLWFLFMKMMGLFGGGLAGIFALAIFTRRTNAAGALVGAVAGTTATVLAWQYTKIHWMLWPAIGVVVCFAVGYVVSWAIPLRRKDLAGLTIYD